MVPDQCLSSYVPLFEDKEGKELEYYKVEQQHENGERQSHSFHHWRAFEILH